MAKQETVRYDKYGLFIDGIQAERITSVSVSGDFGTENVLQLSDSGIVQKVAQSPEVSITVEANFIGSTDNLRLFTDRVLDYATVSATCDPRNQSIKGWNTYDRISAASSNAADRDVDELDMLDSYVDITIPIGDGATSIGRTAHFHRFGLTGYSISLDVAGNATESFTLSGSNRYWYASHWRGVRCHALSDGEIITPRTTTASGTFSVDMRFNSAAVPIGASVIGFFYGNHTAFTNNVADWKFVKTTTVLAAPEAVHRNKWSVINLDVTDANTDWANPFVATPTGSREKAYVLWYHVDSSQTYAGGSTGNWGIEITHTSGTLGAVARQYAEIYLWNSVGGVSSEGDKFLRIQSFNIDVSPESENKYQIGEKEAYSIFRKTPVPVTGSFSVLASDLEPTYMLSGHTDIPSQLTTDDFNAYNQMRVKFYEDEARTTVLSSVMVRNITISNESYSISVGGEGAEEFSFETDNFRFLGTGENPNTP